MNTFGKLKVTGHAFVVLIVYLCLKLAISDEYNKVHARTCCDTVKSQRKCCFCNMLHLAP